MDVIDAIVPQMSIITTYAVGVDRGALEGIRPPIMFLFRWLLPATTTGRMEILGRPGTLWVPPQTPPQIVSTINMIGRNAILLLCLPGSQFCSARQQEDYSWVASSIRPRGGAMCAAI